VGGVEKRHKYRQNSAPSSTPQSSVIDNECYGRLQATPTRRHADTPTRLLHSPLWNIHKNVRPVPSNNQEEELARRYNIPIPTQKDLPISWNIAPSQNVLVGRYNGETGLRSLDALRWGLIPNWAKDEKIGYKTINARMETVDTAPSFRNSFRKRRCLIPADALRRVAEDRWSAGPLLDNNER
jgi:hypothetical protein